MPRQNTIILTVKILRYNGAQNFIAEMYPCEHSTSYVILQAREMEVTRWILAAKSMSLFEVTGTLIGARPAELSRCVMLPVIEIKSINRR